MILVEDYAAQTAAITTIAARLQSLDRAWAVLSKEYRLVASKVRQRHDGGLAAEQDLHRLAELDISLAAVEHSAIEAMGSTLPVLRGLGNG